MSVGVISGAIYYEALAKRVRELEIEANAPVIADCCYEIRKQNPPTVQYVDRPQYRFDGRMKARK